MNSLFSSTLRSRIWKGRGAYPHHTPRGLAVLSILPGTSSLEVLADVIALPPGSHLNSGSSTDHFVRKPELLQNTSATEWKCILKCAFKTFFKSAFLLESHLVHKLDKDLCTFTNTRLIPISKCFSFSLLGSSQSLEVQTTLPTLASSPSPYLMLFLPTSHSSSYIPFFP